MSHLINFNDTEPQVLVPRLDNPSPYVLTSDWTDLPINHLLNVQGSITIGLWLSLQDLVSMSIRVMATDSREETAFYNLPIQLVYQDYSEIKGQEFRVVSGTDKILVSLPLGGIVNFCKVQVKGSGKVVRALATLKGKTL